MLPESGDDSDVGQSIVSVNGGSPGVDCGAWVDDSGSAPEPVQVIVANVWSSLSRVPCAERVD